MIEKLEQEIEELLLNNDKEVIHYICGDNIKPNIKKVIRELEDKHNTSWAVEIYRRNSDKLDNVSINYRGNKITYKEMFEKSIMYAKSLKKLGYEKGDEIPVCMSNIPEFVYLFLAISFIGAKINVVGEWFDKDYLLSILNNTKSGFIFVSDDIYDNIKDVVDKSNIDNVVMVSLTDSLPISKHGNKYDPYYVIDNKFYDIIDKVDKFKIKSDKNIMRENMFTKIGNNYSGKIVEDVGIDDGLAITYTSGTTDPGCPKGCLHANRSYITLSRFKESDVSGMPSMRDLIILAHIPTYTHIQLSCAISDTLYEGCTLAMEPFYDKDFFIYSLLINKPNFVPASVGFWSNVCKLINYDEDFKNIDMPYLMIPTVTGEGMSRGEEKFFNYTSRKHKFGTDNLPFPLAPVTFSIGGGTSESSGIFVTLYKSLQEKKLNNLIKKNTLGLTPHKFAEVEVLDEKGDYCQIGELGLLVAKSPCDMIGYTDPKLNNDIYVYDKNGNTWLSLGTCACKSDNFGRIKMKGRPNNNIYSSTGQKVPIVEIEDIISKDTKNIMSCSLVKIIENDVESYVCHIELQPEAKYSSNKVLESCALRLSQKIPEDILNNLYFRERSFHESFPVAPSGKRDKNFLIAEGLNEKCIPVNSYLKIKNGYSRKKKK